MPVLKFLHSSTPDNLPMNAMAASAADVEHKKVAFAMLGFTASPLYRYALNGFCALHVRVHVNVCARVCARACVYWGAHVFACPFFPIFVFCVSLRVLVLACACVCCVLSSRVCPPVLFCCVFVCPGLVIFQLNKSFTSLTRNPHTGL